MLKRRPNSDSKGRSDLEYNWIAFINLKKKRFTGDLTIITAMMHSRIEQRFDKMEDGFDKTYTNSTMAMRLPEITDEIDK